MQLERETRMKKGFINKTSSSMVITYEERTIRVEDTENTEDRGMTKRV